MAPTETSIRSRFSELIMRLSVIHGPGLREELAGWRRGAIRPETLARFSGEVAAGFGALRVLGAIPAALGAVEFQGRGTITPHILMWSS